MPAAVARVHAAVDRYQAWAQTYRYVLKMDVRQYFPSIDHDLLKEKLRRRIKDQRVLTLLDRIIEGAPGILASYTTLPAMTSSRRLNGVRGFPSAT